MYTTMRYFMSQNLKIVHVFWDIRHNHLIINKKDRKLFFAVSGCN